MADARNQERIQEIKGGEEKRARAGAEKTKGSHGGRGAGAGRPTGRLSYGIKTAKRDASFALERVRDDSVPDEQLGPVELGARLWRRDVLENLGGPGAVAPTMSAAVDTVTVSMLCQALVDRYLWEIASTFGVVDGKQRKLLSLVTERARLADSFLRQLQLLGLERRTPKAPTIDEVIADIAKKNAQDGAAPADAEGPELPRHEIRFGPDGFSWQSATKIRAQSLTGPRCCHRI
jgi:hypothetical protein